MRFLHFFTFAQKIFKGWGCNFTWSFGKVLRIKSLKMVFVLRIIRYKLCMVYAFSFFCSKIIFTKNNFLTAEMNLTTRGPLYTCLVMSLSFYTQVCCWLWASRKTATAWISKRLFKRFRREVWCTDRQEGRGKCYCWNIDRNKVFNAVFEITMRPFKCVSIFGIMYMCYICHNAVYLHKRLVGNTYGASLFSGRISPRRPMGVVSIFKAENHYCYLGWWQRCVYSPWSHDRYDYWCQNFFGVTCKSAE